MSNARLQGSPSSAGPLGHPWACNQAAPNFVAIATLILSFVCVGCGPANAPAETEPTAGRDTQPSSSGNAPFRDPAPPKINELRDVPVPEAKDYARVTFHGPPKPLSSGAVTHDWTSFLGPTHNAISTETRLLKEWPKGGPKLVWELETGSGYASPAILGERLVYQHRIDNEVLVECLHPETGKQYWQFKYQTQYTDRYGYSNGPRSSPVIHKERVYIYGAEGQLICLALETGQVVWQRNLSDDFQAAQDFFGVVTTPLIEGNVLIINVGARGGPCVVGIEADTGKALWGAGEKWGPSYSSPVPADMYGERRVFVFAGGESRPTTGGLLCLDPASGAIDFEFPWRSKSYESVNASCPVVVDNQVFISATYETGSALLKLDDAFKSETVWTTDKVGTHWNTAVHRDGYLYAFDGRNEPDASLVCVELKTGKVVWREVPEWEETFSVNDQEQTQTFTTFRGSLLWADGHFLCLGELGHLLWMDLSPKGYKELQRVWLFASTETWALPVLSRGLLYVSQNRRDFLGKTQPRLLCYDLRGE